MGIRPSIKLLCGITDLKTENYRITDPRWQPASGLDYPDFGDSLDRVVLPVLEDYDKSTFLKNDEVGNFNRPKFLKFMRMSTIKEMLSEPDDTPKEWYKLVQWSAEFGNSHVIGYIIDELPYASHLSYALAGILGNSELIGGAEPGFQFLQSLNDPEKLYYTKRIYYEICQKAAANPEMRTIKYWRNVKPGDKKILGDINRFKLLWKNGWLYPAFSDEMRLNFAIVTSYLFNQLGLRVRMRDLKLLIYWEWS
jgi:hypothetical protein